MWRRRAGGGGYTAVHVAVQMYVGNQGIGTAQKTRECVNSVDEGGVGEVKGMRQIAKTPSEGAGGMTIAFLHPKSTQGILTELCENKNK